MSRQTTEQKRIQELEEQVETLLKSNSVLVEKSSCDNILVAQKNRTIQNLQTQINRINEEMEQASDPALQTIRSCTTSLLRSYSRISCPVTKREAFKQFCAQVMIGIKDDVQKIESEIGLRIQQSKFINNIHHDINQYLEDLVNGKIVREV